MKLFVELTLLTIVYLVTGYRTDSGITYLPLLFCASGFIMCILHEIHELVKANKSLDFLRYK